MNLEDKNIQAFLALVRAGLWEKEVELPASGEFDYVEVKRLAKEQSLLGIVAAGLDYTKGQKPSEEMLLTFLGLASKIEQKNIAMNSFLSLLTKKLQGEGIVFAMVKGQGVAQCYERPMWRGCGDVDLLLDAANYEKAKAYITQYVPDAKENVFDQHFSAIINGWDVELHGSMRGMLTKRADARIDDVQRDMFEHSRLRMWDNNGTNVPLPCADADVLFVFVHILKHFFHYGIGLRQICDWSRMLYTYRSELDLDLLHKRLQEMGLMSEWKAFGALAVDWLGMPSEAMPFYSPDAGWKRKARRIMAYVMETGNFGHNRDRSYLQKSSAIVRLLSSLWLHTCDSARHLFIFPADAVRIWCRLVEEGVKDLFKT